MNQGVQQDPSLLRTRTVTISLLTLCLCFQTLATGAIALFLPMIKQDIGLTFTEAGTLSASAMLFYALMQIPAGYLADRFGAHRVFLAGILGTTSLLLLFAFVSDYWQALVNQAISGLFRGLLFAPGVLLLTGWFSPQRQATAMSLYLVGAFGGQIILNATGPLIVAGFDWRAPFIGFGSLGVVAALAYFRFGKEPPRINLPSKINILDLLSLFRSRVMWLCGIIQYVRLAVLQGVSFWLPTLLIDERGISLQLTGLLMGLRALLIAPSNIAGGYLSDRFRNPPLIIGLSLLVLAFTTALLVVVDNLAALIVLIVINSVFVQLYFAPLFAMPGEVLEQRLSGTAAGFGNFFANLGGFTFAYILGVLKDSTGDFKLGFFTIAGACIIGLASTIWLARIRLDKIRHAR